MKVTWRQAGYLGLIFPLALAAFLVGEKTWWGLFLMALVAPAISFVLVLLGRPSYRLVSPAPGEDWEIAQGESLTFTWKAADSLYRSPVEIRHPWLPEGRLELSPSQKEVSFPTPALPRGLHPVPPLSFRWRDPLHILEAWGEASLSRPLRVLPTPLPMRRPFFLPGQGKSRAFSPLRDPSAWSGIRPFRPGEDPRAIHWPASLRKGRTMVRDWEDDSTRRWLLLIDPRPYPSEDLFEKAIRLALSLALEAEARGIQLYYQEPGQPYPPETLTPLELARRLAELKARPASFYPGRWRPPSSPHLTLFVAAAPTPDRLALAHTAGSFLVAPGKEDGRGFTFLAMGRGERA
ncbi:MAG: DUF58 domain-containing protein [Bacillota bacterium]|nr:DUF58 domain-containing protein [Bacillota bacterium]